MTDDETLPQEEPEKRPLGKRIHDHLVAAEVAAEESAGYGWATEAVEAVEAAVDPEHELGGGATEDEQAGRPSHSEPEKDERTP